jgi:hypothetical protein
MAYSHPSLNLIGPAGAGPKLWMYSTADVKTAVDGAGYFNDAADDLQVGDIILANTGVGGTLQVWILYVASNAAGVVDVTDGLQVTATDSD